MADKDEKPKGAKSLYDNPRSKSDREAAATAEADLERGDKPAADKGAEGAEGEKKALSSSSGDAMLEEMRSMTKRHEGERKDFHNNTRDAMRQMFSRHEKEMADMHKKYHSPREGSATEADGGASMPGGAGVSDGVED